MSSVLKANFIQFSPQNTKVIDANSLVAKRLEGFSGVLRPAEEPKNDEPMLDANGNPLNPLEMAELLGSMEDFSESDDSFHEGIPMETVEETTPEELMEKTLQEIEMIKENARMELESMRSEALESAQAQGYQEGLEKAQEEYDERFAQLQNYKEQLDAEYAQKVRELEPTIVATICDIYEKVFSEQIYSRRDVVAHLIEKALIHEGDEKVLIRVSPADYENLIGMKETMFGKISYSQPPEILMDDSLLPGQAKVETGHGILDCGIDTELKELERMLKILSFEGIDA